MDRLAKLQKFTDFLKGERQKRLFAVRHTEMIENCSVGPVSIWVLFSLTDLDFP